MRNGLVCILAVLVAILISPSIAVAQPPIPADYSGEVTVDGSPAPDGTEIFATIENYTSDKVTTTGGSYEYLVVDPPNDTYVGKTIEFWVDVPGNLSPVKADQTDVFENEEWPEDRSITRNLTVATTTAENNKSTPFPLALTSAVVAVILIAGVWYWRRGR